METETTFEQFKSCLRSAYARQELGLDFSDAEAEGIVSDDALSQEEYAKWLARRRGAEELRPPEPTLASAAVTDRGVSKQAQSVDGRRGSGIRPAPLVTAIVLLTVGLAVATVVGGLEIKRLSNEIVELRSADDEASSEVAALRGTASKTAASMAREKSLQLSIKSTYDAAIGSIVTVHCGDALGSGFAYDVTPASGYSSVIVTNQHVISDCQFSDGPQVSIEIHDGSVPKSKLWDFDEKNDLALIMTVAKLDALLEAPPAEIGDPTIAIGSPLGFAGSVTSGIVSNVYSDAFQTDAAINHGNSGGPLLDRSGKVLGVTTLGLDREGLNIAVRPLMLCKTLITCP